MSANNDGTDDEDHHRHRNSKEGAVTEKEDRRREAADDTTASREHGDAFHRRHRAERHQDWMNPEKGSDQSGNQSHDQRGDQSRSQRQRDNTRRDIRRTLGPSILVMIAAMARAERFAVAMIARFSPPLISGIIMASARIPSSGI